VWFLFGLLVFSDSFWLIFLVDRRVFYIGYVMDY
jgi:hypothetical protein